MVTIFKFSYECLWKVVSYTHLIINEMVFSWFYSIIKVITL